MPEQLYPLALRLARRRVVVVGSGEVALRRVAALLAVDADVTVIAADLPSALADLAARGVLRTEQRSYLDGDLTGAWLAHACSGDPALDAAIAAEAERLRVWCVRAEDSEGTAAEVPTAGTSASTARSSRVLVLGGARSGKSATAEAMLAAEPRVEYVATGPPGSSEDPEWAERVRLHRQRRPTAWRTTETLDLVSVLGGASAGTTADPVLIDCLSMWLNGVMDQCGLWAQRTGADAVLTARTDELVAAWTSTDRHVVAVSNEVGFGVVPATSSGRRFRDELGVLNAKVAAACDEVWLCVAGVPRRLR